MNTIPLVVLGVASGLAGILLFKLQPAKEKQLYAIGLIVAAIIYLGFAMHGDGPKWVGIELLGLMVYGAMALAGSRGSMWWLALGWAAHAGWDMIVHGVHTPFAPRGYAIWCGSLDLTFGLYIAWRLRSARSF